MPNQRLSTFNDGMVSIYREKDRKTDFSAKRNVTSLADMDFVVKLAYQESTKRQQDLEFAEQSGFKLSMKVKTRYVATVKNKLKAVIDGYLYDISYVDKAGQEMYLYLEGVRQIGSDAPAEGQ